MLAKGRPKHVVDMEQRAKKRTQKREELQKLYDEKRRLIEEQKQMETERENEMVEQKIQEEKDKKR